MTSLLGLFVTPMAYHKCKKSPEKKRERRSVTVSTGPWEYYTGYSVQNTENKINSRKRIFIK